MEIRENKDHNNLSKTAQQCAHKTSGKINHNELSH